MEFLKQEGGNSNEQPSRSTVRQNNRRHREKIFYKLFLLEDAYLPTLVSIDVP